MFTLRRTQIARFRMRFGQVRRPATPPGVCAGHCRLYTGEPMLVLPQMRCSPQSNQEICHQRQNLGSSEQSKCCCPLGILQRVIGPPPGVVRIPPASDPELPLHVTTPDESLVWD